VDKLLKDLFGGDDEPTAAPPPAAPAEATATTAAEPREKRSDAEREARREARQRRKADPDRKRKRDDFVERYASGDPSEGFSSDEAIEHLHDLREEMSPAEFRAAMQKTLEHLPPSQRDDFVALMQQYKAGQPAAGGGAAPQAGAAAQGAAADPFGALLGGLMGGGMAGAGAGGAGAGDILDDLRRSGTRAPAPASGQPTEADFRALLDSPLARAVLGGVAAYGMQGMQDEDGESARRRDG
jgi:hypothetical protein